MNDQRQIPLVLPLDIGRAREDLIESASNATAVELIDGWPDWPGKIAILAGPVGSGKSHFASVWADQADAKTMQLSDFNRSSIAGLIGQNLVLEDAGMGAIDEDALFHAINNARANGTFILITSRLWPQNWGVELPDLVSRLRAAMLVELSEPDDFLLKQIVHKQFADRQLEVDPSVVDYLVLRMERSLEAARTIVEALDNEALSRRARITKPMAGQILKTLNMI